MTTEEELAEVLAGHQYSYDRGCCSCGTFQGEGVVSEQIAAHQAAVILDHLTPKLTELKARAWDKGYGKGREDGFNDHMFLSSMRREPNSSRNPYRWQQ